MIKLILPVSLLRITDGMRWTLSGSFDAWAKKNFSGPYEFGCTPFAEHNGTSVFSIYDYRYYELSVGQEDAMLTMLSHKGVTKK